MKDGSSRRNDGSYIRCNSGAAHQLVSSQIQEKRVSRIGKIAKLEIIYQTGRMYFFAFDGFAMYTFECEDSDFKQKVLHAIEFSNTQWNE